MTTQNTAFRGEIKIGDAAADGLFAGVFAGVLMAIYLLAAGLLAGSGTSLVLALFGKGNGPATGALLHLGTAGVYGIAYAVSVRWLLRRQVGLAWLAGLAYGLLLYGLARTIFLPIADPVVSQIPLAHLILSHLVYGSALGFTLGRPARSS